MAGYHSGPRPGLVPPASLKLPFDSRYDPVRRPRALDAASIPMFETLADKIATHARYGPAVTAALETGYPLALNYHNHGPDTGYCVSVCALKPDLLQLAANAELDELAHISGFAQSEADCAAKNDAFIAALRARFQLTSDPLPYLNGAKWDLSTETESP